MVLGSEDLINLSKSTEGLSVRAEFAWQLSSGNWEWPGRELRVGFIGAQKSNLVEFVS